jgi:hypothetical protein
MDVLRQVPYFVGLLNRVFIQAMAASPLIRDVNKNKEAPPRGTSQIWN